MGWRGGAEKRVREAKRQRGRAKQRKKDKGAAWSVETRRESPKARQSSALPVRETGSRPTVFPFQKHCARTGTMAITRCIKGENGRKGLKGACKRKRSWWTRKPVLSRLTLCHNAPDYFTQYARDK